MSMSEVVRADRSLDPGFLRRPAHYPPHLRSVYVAAFLAAPEHRIIGDCSLPQRAHLPVDAFGQQDIPRLASLAEDRDLALAVVAVSEVAPLQGGGFGTA